MSTPDIVTASAVDGPEPVPPDDRQATSLGTHAARQLATTTKSGTADAGHLLAMAAEVAALGGRQGGAYRVNRRLQLRTGRGRVHFEQNGADDIRVIPQTLTELPALCGYPTSTC